MAGKVKRLDRPGLRYKANDLLINCSTHFDNDQLEAVLDVFDQILALIPTEEEIRKDERKRIIDWGNEVCSNKSHHHEVFYMYRRNCLDCWQALKEEGK